MTMVAGKLDAWRGNCVRRGKVNTQKPLYGYGLDPEYAVRINPRAVLSGNQQPGRDRPQNHCAADEDKMGKLQSEYRQHTP